MKPIEIDGSRGEGGGQILRSALTLSLLTGKPFRLRRVRAGRERPGLRPQHLACVEAAAAIAPGTRLRGAALHSLYITFEPETVVPGTYTFRIGTAGSTGLVLQTVLLPLALAAKESSLRIEGGTHVRASPCFDYLERTWRDYLLAIGYCWDLKMVRPGFYPRGGGRIEASIETVRPEGLAPLDLAPCARPDRVSGRAVTAGLPAHIGDRLVVHAQTLLRDAGVDADFERETWPGGPGALLLLEIPGPPARTVFLGLGEKGKPAEQVAEEVVAEFLTYRRADPPGGADGHAADQLLLPLALVGKPSRFRTARVTDHLLTNLEVLQAFLPGEFTCKGAEGSPGIVSIPGR